MKILVVLSFVVLMLAIVACTETEAHKEIHGKGEAVMATLSRHIRSRRYQKCNKADKKRMHNCYGNGKCQVYRTTGLLGCKCNPGFGGQFCERLIP
ncbi:hypothetical protein ACROYT_G026205 [Oculina patagonica]